MSAAELIYLVDDDASVRQALARLIRSAGMCAEVFGTVKAIFLYGILTER